MNPDLVERLRCPRSGERLNVRHAEVCDGRIIAGELVTSDERFRYPIVRGIPRFVPSANYAENFGLQWNRFRRTQLDSHSSVPISRDRFLEYTGWRPEELVGRTVLDVGCGAGRFAEIALQFGARVVAVDYSSAADACLANITNSALDVLQADVYALPFRPGSFDFVYCFGVLQHTPDVKRAFMALPPQLKAGGRLAVDVYPRLLRNVFWSKYWLRPLTSRMNPQTLYGMVERMVPVVLPVSRAVARMPVIGRGLRYALPVINYEGVYQLNSEQLEEWSVLDTFDMLAPRHDHPQSIRTLKSWFEEAGLHDVWVGRKGFNVGRGRRREQEPCY